MRIPAVGLSLLLGIPMDAGAQMFQPVETQRYQAYHVMVFDPQNCEGLDDEIDEWRYDLEPMDGLVDRTFRCLQTRARGLSIHDSAIGPDTINAHLRTTSDLSNGAIVPNGLAMGEGDNSERFTFDLVQATKFRVTGSARGHVTGDPEFANEVYLDAGFIFEGEGVQIELIFSDELPGEGSLDREVICPPGRYTFAAAATVWSCRLSLEQPQQVAADAEVAVRIEVVDCPGDLNVDNACDVLDLARLLGHFGLSVAIERSDGDLDGNHRVDAADLSLLLASFGQTCW